MGISFHRGSTGGDLEGGSSTRLPGTLRDGPKGGCWNGAFISEQAQRGTPLGRVPFLWALEDVLIFWRWNYFFKF